MMRVTMGISLMGVAVLCWVAVGASTVFTKLMRRR